MNLLCDALRDAVDPRTPAAAAARRAWSTAMLPGPAAAAGADATPCSTCAA